MSPLPTLPSDDMTQSPEPQNEAGVSAEGSSPVAEPTPPQPAKKTATKSKGRRKKRTLAQQQATARLIAHNQARRASSRTTTRQE